MNKKKKILITGSSGFLGTQILNSLLKKRNVELYLVLRKKNLLLSKLDNVKIIITKDLFSESVSWWKKKTKNIDIIIHSAWYVEPGKFMVSNKNLDCLSGTINMALGAAKSGIKKFVGVGTCAEYDTAKGYLDVNTRLNPTIPYSAAKVSTFIALEKLLPTFKVNFCWCRVFYLYGENEDSRRLVPYLREKLSKGEKVLLGSGKEIKDYIDVKKAGQLIVKHALSSKGIGAKNICSGVGTSVRELAESIADEYNRRDLLVFGVRKSNPFDSSIVVGVL